MGLDITISDSTTFYRPVLEIFKDRKVHKSSEIIDEIRNMLPNDEKEDEKVKNWVYRPIQHFHEAGCIERVNKGLYCITEDGEKLLNKDLKSLDRKVLKKYCPKYREKYENSSNDDEDDNEDYDDSIEDEIINEDITFEDALNIVKNVLIQVGTKINADDYDMLLVKELSDSDIILKNKSPEAKGKTTHIALTEEKMDLFPYLESYSYFYKEPGEYSESFKGRFLLEVPVNLYSSNLKYLGDNNRLDESEKIPTTVTVVRNRKNKEWKWDKFKKQVDKLENAPYKRRSKLLGYEVQAELSSKLSGVEFKGLRDLLYKDYFLIILKCKNEMKYDIFAVRPEDGKELKDIDFTLFIPKQKLVTLVSPNSWTTETGNGDNYSPKPTDDADSSSLWTIDADTDNIVDNAENRLIYGVPGSGKSYTIKDDICEGVDESCIERVVFHPDYTYSDFVGQILPKVSENKVRYEFTRGPFTSILAEACSNPGKEFYLIIEEINRGNAPAIFGDIFQLLDRIDDEEGEFPIGTSEYAISNSYVAYEVYENEHHKIRIPPNLNIIATMNTADQNVFTLDTAFQRRWNMQLIPNKFDNKHKFADKNILDTGITWKSFVNTINDSILKKNTLTTSSEDKRLGVYFIKEEDLYDEKAFAEKVLKYLWDDAFKFSRDKIFIEDCDCLEILIESFTTSKGKERFDIFIDNESMFPESSDGENSEEPQ